MDAESGDATSVTPRVAEAFGTAPLGAPDAFDIKSLEASLPKLVITLEGADLTLAPCPDGFSYKIETREGIGNEVLAAGEVVLNSRGKLLIMHLLQLFQESGPLRGETFEARVIVD